MFDFRFGNVDEVRHNSEEFVIFVKHLLPRWLNGITDQQCLALLASVRSSSSTGGVLIETGCGASTIPLVVDAILNDRQVFSWDISGHKGSQLRLVLAEAIGLALEVDVNDYWTFIAADSLDPLVGIGIIKEMGLAATFGFFDSQHTLDQLRAEVELAVSVSSPNLVIALDDAYYRSIAHNYAYRNLQRLKLGLPSVIEPSENIGPEFRDAIFKILSESFAEVKDLGGVYIADPEDVHLRYFSQDRKVFGGAGMEARDRLQDRFSAWSCTRPS